MPVLPLPAAAFTFAAFRRRHACAAQLSSFHAIAFRYYAAEDIAFLPTDTPLFIAFHYFIFTLSLLSDAVFDATPPPRRFSDAISLLRHIDFFDTPLARCF